MVLILIAGAALLAAAVAWIWRQGLFGTPGGGSEAAAWPLTPYDSLVTFYDDVRSEGTRPFDVFISYKSEDAHLVRGVVNRLIAGGGRPWFAEYLILLAERGRFDGAIEAGIRRSRAAILFTNDRYAASPHCRRELDLLLGPEGVGMANVVEVQLAPGSQTREYRPDLAALQAIEYSGDPDRLMSSLSQRLGVRAAPSHAAPVPHRLRLPHKLRPFSLDLAGWRIDFSSPASRAGGFAFRRTLAGRRVRFNVIAGEGVVAPRRVSGTLDDRDVFDRSIEFADAYADLHGLQCAGVHLLFHEGFSHLGLTYWQNRCWACRYSLVLPGARADAPSLEFAFGFGFFGPFAECCRAMPVFERVVLSLRPE